MLSTSYSGRFLRRFLLLMALVSILGKNYWWLWPSTFLDTSYPVGILNLSYLCALLIKNQNVIDARFAQILNIYLNVDIINFVRIGMTLTHRRRRIDKKLSSDRHGILIDWFGGPLVEQLTVVFVIDVWVIDVRKIPPLIRDRLEFRGYFQSYI